MDKKVQEQDQNQNGLKHGKEKSTDNDSYLQKIYYDTRHPASFSRMENLYIILSMKLKQIMQKE